VQLMRVSNGYTKSWVMPATSQAGGQVEIGDCGYSNCAWQTPTGTVQGYVDKTYFRLDTPALVQRHGEAAHIYYASFDVEQTANSNGCTDRLTDLYSSGIISSSTSWPGPEIAKVGIEQSNRGGGSACPPGNVQFDSDDVGDEQMASYLQQDADNNWGAISFELRADAENDDLQYKLFKNDPTISVYYNFAPLVPDELSVKNQVTCDPAVTYTSLAQPDLSARGTDNNPNPLPLTWNFTLETSAGTAAGGTLSHPAGASGTVQSTTPPVALTNGTAYQFRSTVTNNPGGEKVDTVTIPALTSAISGWYPFTVLTGPTAPPTISSFDYPKGQWGQPAGAPGVFTVGTNGQSNIAGFAYTFDGGAASEPVPTTTDCNYLADGGLGTSANANGGGNPKGELALNQGSTTQIQVPQNLAAGQHTLYVESFDKAHNASKEAAYTFYVAPNYLGPASRSPIPTPARS